MITVLETTFLSCGGDGGGDVLRRHRARHVRDELALRRRRRDLKVVDVRRGDGLERQAGGGVALEASVLAELEERHRLEKGLHHHFSSGLARDTSRSPTRVSTIS